MKNQVLSIEHSKNLNELGIDTRIASIYWARRCHESDIRDESKGKWFLSLNDKFIVAGFTHYEVVPTFTLQDIIELLPDEIKIGKESYKLNICPLREYWCISYDGVIDNIMVKRNKSILEATYQMLVWLINNGYLDDTTL